MRGHGIRVHPARKNVGRGDGGFGVTMLAHLVDDDVQHRHKKQLTQCPGGIRAIYKVISLTHLAWELFVDDDL